MKRIEYYKKLKQNGMLSKLYMGGLIDSTPFLMIDTYDLRNALSNKTRSFNKETAETLNISVSYVNKLIRLANEVIF